jgi:hypothetical protein
MRFWLIKIIFLIGTLICHNSVAYAKEYDFSFDVRKPKLDQNSRIMTFDPLQSTTSWRLGMQATLLPDFLQGSGELVYGGFDDNSNSGFSGWDKYLMKLGVSGKRDTIGYGISFYSVGKKYAGKFNSTYKDKKGYTGYESWLSWNFEKFQVKTKFAEYWTKTPRNSYLSTLKRWYEIETSYPLSSGPFAEVSMAYRLGGKSSTISSRYLKIYDGSLNTLKAKFRFADDYLKLSTEVNQSRSQNNLYDRKSFRQEMVYIKSTLFPKKVLSLISSYRYSVNTYSSYYYKKTLNKLESTVGLLYKPMDIPGSLKFTSAFNSYRSDDGGTDKDIVNFGAQYDWKAQLHNTGVKTSWTVNFRYKDVKNYINPDSNTSNWSLNLLWRLPLS